MSTLMSYDPFHRVRTLQNELNRLFDPGWDDGNSQMAKLSMGVDIREDENQIVIKADLPGMSQEAIQVNVEHNTLTISGERTFGDEVNRDRYHRVERAYGRFSRSFQLPNTTDTANIKASYVNGVLEVALPKREESKPRAIQIEVQ
ncbi:heat shock protein Hsp20 [Magnetococcus marinus MC-1]|uniref:Heat shock protein Hsp20 n=1 Tax=Magnetococcus marinus (strain ATCC BAA-1437 / JCM 17883 / MC-1) TaxID=156889 RepID=A0LC76_MAGMM|nr:Hsp20/alpha crystallin family protein [Magnetococcus marinus]ABK45569.1 heat shock protein Hsp20 [Magnetococcus marinus MC-1]